MKQYQMVVGNATLYGKMNCQVTWAKVPEI